MSKEKEEKQDEGVLTINKFLKGRLRPCTSLSLARSLARARSLSPLFGEVTYVGSGHMECRVHCDPYRGGVRRLGNDRRHARR